jgi:hypothetical protein
MPRYRAGLAVVTALLVLAGCTANPPRTVFNPASTPSATTPETPDRPHSRIAAPAHDTTVVVGTSAADLAIATSKALFQQAPAVVLVGETDRSSMTKGVATATQLGVPLLLTPTSAPTDAGGSLRSELTRLAPQTILTIGTQATSWQRDAGAKPTPSVSVTPYGDDPVALPDVVPAPPLSHLLVLAIKGGSSAAAVATARAAGARVLMLSGPDPRTSSDAIRALKGDGSAQVLALGSAFGSAELLRGRVETAATGLELPGGGQIVFPGRRMVALYGHPGDTVLGSLGEQNLTATIARARKVASAYRALVKEPVIPAFEIIATVAAASAGSDGNYSNETPVASLRPWVEAALSNGIYVVLDLQPGRSDFLSQAKLYTDLLLYPNVGLALDPEWHMKSNQVPMEVIGSVDASEINKTAQWLADLTRAHNLPQKILMLHQFRLDMITHRSSVVTDYDQLRIVIHADGFGSTPQKYNTWNALHIDPPSNVVWGWKNFYDEDQPTLTPAQTMAVRPMPYFVSYQ